MSFDPFTDRPVFTCFHWLCFLLTCVSVDHRPADRRRGGVPQVVPDPAPLRKPISNHLFSV